MEGLKGLEIEDRWGNPSQPAEEFTDKRANGRVKSICSPGPGICVTTESCSNHHELSLGTHDLSIEA